MKELILEYINTSYYVPEYRGGLFRIEDDSQFGYVQLELLIKTIFNLTDDLAHAITFNWLLSNGVELVKKDWNKSYIDFSNSGVMDNYDITITEDIDFEYIITNE